MQDDWKKCGQQCAGEDDCKAWSWNIKTRQCATTEEEPSDIDSLVISLVSGGRECGGQDFLLETAVKDAGAESQHWTIHLDRISLHGTDFYLERSQTLIPPTYQTTVTGPRMAFKWNFQPFGRFGRGNIFLKIFCAVSDQVIVGASCYRVLQSGEAFKPTYDGCGQIEGILAEPSESEAFFPPLVQSDRVQCRR